MMIDTAAAGRREAGKSGDARRHDARAGFAPPCRRASRRRPVRAADTRRGATEKDRPAPRTNRANDSPRRRVRPPPHPCEPRERPPRGRFRRTRRAAFRVASKSLTPR
ncbi:hypothetical protein EGT86_12760 [Burkholderia pseudomallei]|nr:hypothetical protein EGT86_12760 [Burkholderia pseudomallei]